MTALGVVYDFEIGDVIRGEGKLARHPILFIQDTEDHSDFFEGCMTTSKGDWEDNVILQKEFIKEFDEHGDQFSFQFDNTHIVRARLEKKKDWAPFQKVGEMTEEGIKFVTLEINGLPSEEYEDYRKTSRRK